MRTGALLVFVAASAVFPGGDSAHAAVSAPAKCEAAKNQGAGRYASCLHKAAAKLVKAKGACSVTTADRCYRDDECPTGEACAKDTTKFAKAVAKCDAKFAKAWSAAEDGAACPDGLARDDLQQAIANCVADVADALAGISGCTTDAACAAGEYCDESTGACVESALCGSDPECGTGMECDCSGSCVPAGSGDRSCAPPDCSTEGCPLGHVCTAEGVCEPDQPPPPSCATDADCATGDYCSNQVCVETSICSSDDQCPQGQSCDESRSTCVPTPPPPPACLSIIDQPSCEERPDCRSVIGGITCQLPDSTVCRLCEADCVCDSFVFLRCIPR